MSTNPFLEVKSLGQSIWLDYFNRILIKSGDLKALMEEDGVSGITVNPTIFREAMVDGTSYDADMERLLRQDKRVEEICAALLVEDMRTLTTIFEPVYKQTKGNDGFVSLEVSPLLARQTRQTIAEARRYWEMVHSTNLLIKVPATKEGLEAIAQLTALGVNINVTLLFGLPRYKEVTEAYLSGLEARIKKGLPVDRITSVASFFLSRIDSIIDPILERKAHESEDGAFIAQSLRGRIAIDSAKIAYQLYREIFSSDRFKQLSQKGAKPQKLVWASTGAKNPLYSATKYVDALIGSDTINTMPLETFESFRYLGSPALRLEDDIETAKKDIGQLRELGIDLEHLTQKLEVEGVEKFSESYESLLRIVKEKCENIKKMKSSK